MILRNPKKTSSSKLPKKAFLAIFTLILVLSVANIIFSCHLAVSGEKIKGIEEEIQRVEAEKERLKERVVALSSFATVSQKAAKLGFVKPSSIIYLGGPKPLAMR